MLNPPGLSGEPLLSINLTLGHKKRCASRHTRFQILKTNLKLTLNLKLTNKPLKHILKQSFCFESE